MQLAFFGEFAGERLDGGLVLLDAAAGQMPARNVSVTDQEYSVPVMVMDDGADPERHRPGKKKVTMKEARPDAGPTGLTKFGLAHIGRLPAKGWHGKACWRKGL